MLNLGMTISVCGFSLCAIILARGISKGYLKLFPLFYSYMIYEVSGTAVMYGVYVFYRQAYPSAFWYYYLLGILVEFSVLVEISDHIFQPFPAIRRLGRALTLLISIGFAIFYLIPSIIGAQERQAALLDFTLRSSVTKLVIILAILIASRQFKSKLGMNVAGLILGFTIYLGVNVANSAAAKAFDPAIYAQVLWIISTASYGLCVLVWTVSLWNCVPASSKQAVAEGDPRDIELGLTRFNHQLSKFLER